MNWMKEVFKHQQHHLLLTCSFKQYNCFKCEPQKSKELGSLLTNMIHLTLEPELEPAIHSMQNHEVSRYSLSSGIFSSVFIKLVEYFFLQILKMFHLLKSRYVFYDKP